MSLSPHRDCSPPLPAGCELCQQQAELLYQQQKDARVQELMAIAQRCAAHITQPVQAVAHGELLYDEHGMPQ